MSEKIFTNNELESFEVIKNRVKDGESVEDCVCCFFVKENRFLGNPSPSYGKIGTIAGKVENGESLGDALVREADEEASIKIMPDKLGDMLVSYEDIKERLYRSHSYRGVLNSDFEPKMTITQTNLESLPILIHKDALPLMEYFGFNPPNNTSLISWALKIKRIEILDLDLASKHHVGAFEEFLDLLEMSMNSTKQRGLELMPVVEEQYQKKVTNKMAGIEGFFDKISKARKILSV